jgi:hypothetical protein
VIEMEVRQQQIDVADAAEAGRVAYQAPGTAPEIEKQGPLSVADQQTRRLSCRGGRGTATAKELEAHARRLIAGDGRPLRQRWPPPFRKEDSVDRPSARTVRRSPGGRRRAEDEHAYGEDMDPSSHIVPNAAHLLIREGGIAHP